MIQTLILLLLSPSAHGVERPAPLPDPLPIRTVSQDAPAHAVLSNGMEVRVVTDDRAPLFEIRWVTGVGSYVDPVGKEGLADAAFDLLIAGNATHDADSLSREARRLGIRLSSSASRTRGQVSASGLVRNLEPAIALWAESILQPAYAPEELETWRTAKRSALALRDSDPSRIAGRLWWQLAYGDGDLGRAPSLTSIDALQPEDLAELHRSRLGPANSTLLVGGDVTLEQVLPLLEAHFGGWDPPVETSAGVQARPVEVDGPILYAVDHPGASQSHLRSGTPLPPRTAAIAGEAPAILPHVFPLGVANHAFGGAFTSRVNLNLREDKGFTYGARCSVTPLPREGWWTCSTSVKTGVTGPALQELQRELADWLGDRPLTEEEVSRARQAIARRWPASMETVSARLDREAEIWHHDLPRDWIPGYVERVTAVDTSGANEAVRSTISPQRMFWLVVGDLGEIQDDLQRLGLPIVRLDTQGRAISDDVGGPSAEPARTTE